MGECVDGAFELVDKVIDMLVEFEFLVDVDSKEFDGVFVVDGFGVDVEVDYVVGMGELGKVCFFDARDEIVLCEVVGNFVEVFLSSLFKQLCIGCSGDESYIVSVGEDRTVGGAVVDVVDVEDKESG